MSDWNLVVGLQTALKTDHPVTWTGKYQSHLHQRESKERATILSFQLEPTPADTANLTPSQYAPAGETKFAMSCRRICLILQKYPGSWVHLEQFLDGPCARASRTWSFKGKKWELVRLLSLRRVLASLSKSAHVSEIVSIKGLEILFLHNWVDHILIDKLYSC